MIMNMVRQFFLDLQKAFDLVDINIIISKLEFYGVRGTILDVFRSFLSNRKQYIKIENIKSDLLDVHIGTP